MGDRPEWMPSTSDINLAASLDEERWMNCPSIEALIRLSCLRAQIAALEEVWKEMPSEDFDEDEPLYRKDMVFLKIAALRKELGG